MPVRLLMKLGVLAETDRLSDSADSITVVEPTIGSVARTKGSLYLLVTAAGGRKLRDAVRIVAETIRTEYYYDESAGIAVCLGKAIRLANKRLLHTGGGLGGRRGEVKPIGVAAAVVRGSELYVATVGPAEAYLVRQARLLTLPDVSPDDGLPTADAIEVDPWHGEMLVGDTLVLVSPNVTRQVGLSPVQDAAVTLHPQPAIDQLHRMFASNGGTGSDGMLAIEATEVPVTHKTRPLKPVWPADPLAGAPDRSPIPLADTVSEGVAAMQTSAREARSRAAGGFQRLIDSLLDMMPRRSTPRRKVTPMSVRRERERRLAVGVIGLCVFIAASSVFLFMTAGRNKADLPDQQNRARQAYQMVLHDLDLVSGQGRNLLESNPAKAGEYLNDAWNQLQIALDNGFSASDLAPYRAQVVDGLNKFYHVVWVKPATVVSFGQHQLSQLILGPDKAAYLIDATESAVYRVDLVAHTKRVILKKGDAVPGGVVGTPRLLTVGGPDVVVLDGTNAIWRWRPTAGDKTGKGTAIRINISGSTEWSGNIRALGTYVTNPESGLYSLYVVDPSAKNIRRYRAAADGSSYTTGDTYLAVDQDVSGVDDMLIDGSLYLVQSGQIVRFDTGQTSKGWSVHPPDDQKLRAGAPHFSKIASYSDQDTGTLYAYDSTNHRVIAFNKENGEFDKQFLSAGDSKALSAVGEMFVLPDPTGDFPMLYWTEGGNLMSASLNPAAPSVQPTPSPTLAPCASPGPSTKPAKGGTPKPSGTPCATRAPATPKPSASH